MINKVNIQHRHKLDDDKLLFVRELFYMWKYELDNNEKTDVVNKFIQSSMTSSTVDFKNIDNRLSNMIKDRYYSLVDGKILLNILRKFYILKMKSGHRRL